MPNRIALVIALISVPFVAEARSARGVVVDELGQGGIAARSDLLVGDVVLEARLPPASAATNSRLVSVASPFDLIALQQEEGQRAPVVLRLERDGHEQSATLLPGDWRLSTRPVLEGPSLTLWNDGARALAEGGGATWEIWTRAAQGLGKSQAGERTGLWFRAAQRFARTKDWVHAHRAYEAARKEAPAPSARLIAALSRAEESRTFAEEGNLDGALLAARDAVAGLESERPRSLLLARALGDMGSVSRERGDLEAAEAPLTRALALCEELAPDTLAVAAAAYDLALLGEDRRDLETAERLHQRAHALRQQAAPDTLELAASVTALGNLAWQRGKLARAQELYTQAAALRERLAPGSPALAGSWQNLGLVAWGRGDLSAADKYLQNGLGVFEEEMPGSPRVADALINVGLVLTERGDFDAAERALRRALTIYERVAPNSGTVGTALFDLGNLASRRQDLAAAEQYYNRALAIDPDRKGQSADAAAILSALALVQFKQERFEEAGRTGQKAVEILRAMAPGGLDLATSLNVLAGIKAQAGAAEAAEGLFKESLALAEEHAPNSLEVAYDLNGLGLLASERGALDEAVTQLERALAIASSIVPGTAEEAGFLYDLGRVRRKQKRLREAASLFRRAIEDIEAQEGRLGASDEVRAAFAASYKDCYRAYVDVLLELGERDEAFRGVERYRARSFLTMLAERDLTYSADLPPTLAREWKEVDAQYAKVQTDLAHSGGDAESAATKAMLVDLGALRSQKADLKRRIRETAPRLAALRYPEPLSASDARNELDPGTALVSFFVERDRTLLFVLNPNGPAHAPMSVRTLPWGEAELEGRVTAFVQAIRNQTPTMEVVRLSHELYGGLLAAAEPLLLHSERLLIVPDGPLHRLPFGALVRRREPGRPQYLVEWRALHTVLSATVYGELLKTRTTLVSRSGLTAFGDPTYPRVDPERREQIAATNLRSALRSVAQLEPLPYTKTEIAAIADLYPEQVTVFTGDAATEEKATEQGRAKYLHFACHSLLDEYFPINSALALSVPADPREGEDDGLLQAWEVIDRVRLSADLVTLSACETGLGEELGGEGLVGLTRAFQYAGARSVMASLWSVSDKSTADLMKGFYAGLRKGRSKADALRDAQLALLAATNPVDDGPERGVSIRAESSRDPAHPFRWAAFELVGDWR